jgi:hypothetical protein
VKVTSAAADPEKFDEATSAFCPGARKKPAGKVLAAFALSTSLAEQSAFEASILHPERLRTRAPGLRTSTYSSFAEAVVPAENSLIVTVEAARASAIQRHPVAAIKRTDAAK